MSRSRTSASPRAATTSWPKASALSSEVCGVDRGLDEVALDLAGGGGEVVGGKRGAHLQRRDAERRHFLRVEPDAHGERLPAEDLRVGDAVDGLQLGLHHARQVVGDLRRGQHVAVERQVHERRGLARLLDDDGVHGLLRQDAAHLVDLGQHVGDGAVRVGVEAQVERHRADVLLRGRAQRVDAFGAGHRLLDRGR